MKLRIVQWTTGLVGRSAVKAVLDHPDLELVGCYAWSADKVGTDVGELCGLGKIGVMATNDLDTILALRGRSRLLQDDYRLRLSIRLRNPYVDPISLLQVELLRRWRDAGREDEALLQALVTTVNGIAAGIQNTG